ADRERRQLPDAVDVLQRGRDPVELVAQRLAAGEAKRLTRAQPCRVAGGIVAGDVDEPVALPLAAVGFSQARIPPWLQADPGADGPRRLGGAAQVRRPQRPDADARDALRQLGGLTPAGV